MVVLLVCTIHAEKEDYCKFKDTQSAWRVPSQHGLYQKFRDRQGYPVRDVPEEHWLLFQGTQVWFSPPT